MVEAG
jgi:hypothetical protein